MEFFGAPHPSGLSGIERLQQALMAASNLQQGLELGGGMDDPRIQAIYARELARKGVPSTDARGDSGDDQYAAVKPTAAAIFDKAKKGGGGAAVVGGSKPSADDDSFQRQLGYLTGAQAFKDAGLEKAIEYLLSQQGRSEKAYTAENAKRPQLRMGAKPEGLAGLLGAYIGSLVDPNAGPLVTQGPKGSISVGDPVRDVYRVRQQEFKDKSAAFDNHLAKLMEAKGRDWESSDKLGALLSQQAGAGGALHEALGKLEGDKRSYGLDQRRVAASEKQAAAAATAAARETNPFARQDEAAARLAAIQQQYGTTDMSKLPPVVRAQVDRYMSEITPKAQKDLIPVEKQVEMQMADVAKIVQKAPEAARNQLLSQYKRDAAQYGEPAAYKQLLANIATYQTGK